MNFNLFGFNISNNKKRNTVPFNPIGNQWGGFGIVGRTPVTEKTALSLSAYWAGVRLISESIAMLPIDVLRKVNGRREETIHPTEFLLNAEANHQSIAFNFRQIMVTSAINHGNGLAIIERNGAAIPTGLVNVRKDMCKPVLYDDELFWNVKISDSKTLVVKDRDMLNLQGFGTDPVLGLSILEYHKQNLGLSIAAQDYGEDFYNKGTRIDGYIEYMGTLDRETKDAIGSQWTKNYGPNGKRGVAILDEGSKYHPMSGLKPADAQFIETRKFQKSEIYTILGIPNSDEDSKYNNMEQKGINFTTYTIGTWITKLEQEYKRKLLRESEKASYYYKHNVNALLRTDKKSQAEHFRLMSDIGAYSINDILELLDRNQIDGGDERYVQLNRINIKQIDEFYTKENETSK